MSVSSRLAALEALAKENNEKLKELQHINWLLRNYNAQQATQLSQYEQDLSLEPTEDDELAPFPPSPIARHIPPSHPLSSLLTDQLFPSPAPRPTPFYLAARDARHVQLAFVIPGFQGETLEVGMNTVDLAFILERTLDRRGFGDVMTRRGVEDFLACPMVEAWWRGREGRVGRL
ncbi:hypothetical protein EJ02DRAFT_508849 [Clathrospora elynae]|uniref:Uncharacterized protein n=1 Tax=Clathrospora elynae TaxID=706981 RepID=A0A6A5T2R5_9PLEO|nr:hypothetical protein EJ02DRAFT_508849 [Clathrospora elynae]